MFRSFALVLSLILSGSSPAGDIIATIEEPAAGAIYTGVGNLRGWAVSTDTVTQVDLHIDDEFVQSLPYGGVRDDVAGAYPGHPDAAQSGFSIAYNYSKLASGIHTVKVVVTDNTGAVQSATASFEVVKFHTDFIADESLVSLADSHCSLVGSVVSVDEVLIDGTAYGVNLSWDTARQNWSIVGISGGAAPASLLNATADGRVSTADAPIVAVIEEPADGSIYSGISNLRGWAVASSGIREVALYIDDAYVQQLPYGGVRNDVGAIYPGYPDAGYSGFSIAYNYSKLGVGPHSVTLLITDNDGNSSSVRSVFNLTKFGPSFIADAAEVSLANSTCSIESDTLRIGAVEVGSLVFDAQMHWDNAQQSWTVRSIGGSNGTISGRVEDADTGEPVPGATVVVKKGSGLLESVAGTDAGGEYSVAASSGDVYSVEISTPDYESVEYGSVTVESGETTTLNTVPQVPRSLTGEGSVSGEIVDADSGLPVVGAEVRVRKGMNVFSGPVVDTATTGGVVGLGVSAQSGSGVYELNLRGGNYTAEVLADGFAPAYFNLHGLGGRHVENQNGAVGGDSPFDTAAYRWSTGEWSDCTGECGSGAGVMSRDLFCRSTTGETVEAGLCKGRRPATTASCTVSLCETYSWHTGDWDDCVGECGTGNGSQNRLVTCRNASNQIVADGNCSATKPAEIQSCTASLCATFEWYTGEWSECSGDCGAGNGSQSRVIYCRSTEGVTAVDSDCTDSKPADSQSCTVSLCTTIPDAPAAPDASDATHSDRVSVVWDPVTGATMYEVYRCSSAYASSCGSPIRSFSETLLYDTLAVEGIVYYYRIKACNDAGCSDFSSPDAGSRALAEEQILQDDFESGGTVAWQSWGRYPRLVASDDWYRSGIYSASVLDDDIALLKREFTPVTSGVLEVTAYVLMSQPESNAYLALVVGNDYPNASNSVLRLSFGHPEDDFRTLMISAAGATRSVNSGLSALSGYWYKIMLSHDFSTGISTLSANGRVLDQATTEITSLSYVSIGDGTSASGMGNSRLESVADSYYIDDVSVVRRPLPRP